jgi:hypothetical protein
VRAIVDADPTLRRCDMTKTPQMSGLRWGNAWGP